MYYLERAPLNKLMDYINSMNTLLLKQQQYVKGIIYFESAGGGGRVGGEYSVIKKEDCEV